MINICSIRDLKNYPNATKYAIVRSLSRPIANVEQLSELSPNKQLFFWYRNTVNSGTWGPELYINEYVPKFMAQMRSDKKAQEILIDLIKRSKREEIALACFCSDLNLCHRKIVAAILKENGAEMGDIK